MEPQTDTTSETSGASASDFDSFGLKPELDRAIREAGFQTPSPIQKQAIPVIMQGRDVIGQAHTGTGKTAAFGLPGLNALKIDEPSVQMLVITPTRELANQVSEELYRLGRFLKVQTVAVYGGQSYSRQIDSVRRGAQVVVATPGRLLDLLNSGRLKKHFSPSLIVLDEADEMLDMGFLEDIQKILAFLPEERQTLLFSATMPPPIRNLADRFLKSPELIQVNSTEATSRDIRQFYYVIDDQERDNAIVRLIDSMNPAKSVVFCRTKKEADRVAGTLAGRGLVARPIHGDLDQAARERVIAAFRKSEVQVLVATDVAARGIDVPGITHVFNYHIPYDSESYVHRIGRTGRAGKTGVAVTLVTPGEFHELRRIKSKVGAMENRLIPTHHELRKMNEKRLVEEIRNQPVEADAERFLLTLIEEMGLAQAANKLAGLLLGQVEVTGPDRIGVQGSRLERLQAGPGQSQKKPFTKKGRPISARPFSDRKFGGKKPGKPGSDWTASKSRGPKKAAAGPKFEKGGFHPEEAWSAPKKSKAGFGALKKKPKASEPAKRHAKPEGEKYYEKLLNSKKRKSR